MSLRYPKVSILMPSLNSGEYIRECMDSVVKQTLPEIEIKIGRASCRERV